MGILPGNQGRNPLVRGFFVAFLRLCRAPHTLWEDTVCDLSWLFCCPRIGQSLRALAQEKSSDDALPRRPCQAAWRKQRQAELHGEGFPSGKQLGTMSATLPRPLPVRLEL